MCVGAVELSLSAIKKIERRIQTKRDTGRVARLGESASLSRSESALLYAVLRLVLYL